MLGDEPQTTFCLCSADSAALSVHSSFGEDGKFFKNEEAVFEDVRPQNERLLLELLLLLLLVSCSLSASTLSCSSGSSRGSLTSSRGSLATTSSLGSTSSLSFTDLYLEQPDLSDPDFQNKLDSLLQEGGPGVYRPPSSITTIHEHEVVAGCGGKDAAARPENKTVRPGGDAECSAAGSGGASGGLESSRIQALKLSETPQSMSSLSPRSSLSSLSPPCSPLVTDTTFLSGDTFACQTEPGGLGLDLELHNRLAELELRRDSEEQLQDEHRGRTGLEEKQNHQNSLGEEGKGRRKGSFLIDFLN